LLSLLDESVEQDHPPFLMDIEPHWRDPLVDQVRSDFVNSIAHGFTNRHPYGPSKFQRLDVFSDVFAV
jgi:hypothetical protein